MDGRSSAPRLEEGDKVEDNKGRLYPGLITRGNGDGTFNLDYDDGEKETRLAVSLVRAVGGISALWVAIPSAARPTTPNPPPPRAWQSVQGGEQLP